MRDLAVIGNDPPLTPNPEVKADRPIPKPEARLYDRSGIEYAFRGVLDDGWWVVSTIMEYSTYDGDTETYPTDTMSVIRPCDLFTTPPKPVVHADVAALRAQAKALRDEINALRSEKMQFEREVKEREERIKRHKGLERLDDWIAGKINFIVFSQARSGGKYIGTLGDLESKERYDKFKLPLLTLLGATKGQLDWQLNQYSDGSGSKSEIVVCETEDEAKAILQARIDALLAEWKANGNASLLAEAQRIADAHGLDFPDDAERALKMLHIANLERKVMNSQSSLADAISSLNEARSKL